MYAHTELTRFQDDICCSGPDFNRIIYAISKFQPDYLRRFKVLQCDTHLMLCMREMHVQESLYRLARISCHFEQVSVFSVGCFQVVLHHHLDVIDRTALRTFKNPNLHVTTIIAYQT